MNKQRLLFHQVVASALLLVAVFLGIKAYRPAASGVTPANFWSGPQAPQPWSHGPSFDPVLATVAAACVIAAVFLFRKRD